MATAPRMVDLDGHEVRVSSPDKPYFPDLGLSKGDVVDYFLAVGPGILAALQDRPTTMERWPGGVQPGFSLQGPGNPDGEAFYQKRVPQRGVPEWVQSATITFPSGRTAREVCPQDLATIIWMVNLGTLRFHPWPVRGDDTDSVDQLRIDLDPQPGSTFAQAVTAAKTLRGILADLGLVGYVKTSGGRGLHVFVPVRGCDFIDARHAVIAIGRLLAAQLPELVTVDWWKEERGERIFVDFNQMARDRTIASAYSIRPVPQARVSAPLTWDEVDDDLDPDQFTVVTMLERFAEIGDPWAEMYETEPPSIDGALAAWSAEDIEMPYPPEYPKMPGEPPRVQPSRKNAANWEAES